MTLTRPKFSLGVFPYDTEVRSGYENFEEAYFDIFTTLKEKKKKRRKLVIQVKICSPNSFDEFQLIARLVSWYQ